MDPNIQTPPPQPQPDVANSQVPPTPKKSNMALTILVTILVVLTGGAAVYLFINTTRQNKKDSQPANYIQATVAPTASPTPELNEEVDAVDLGTDEADFDTIQEEENTRGGRVFSCMGYPRNNR